VKKQFSSIVATLSNTLEIHLDCQKVWIAYSGGLDSHVLLHAAAKLRHQKHFALHAIHIHHGLNREADSWATHCQNICAVLNIPCEIVNVNIQCLKGDSIEACARKARYAAIANYLNTNEFVLTAQHADDQAETVLLQLLRGAGISGLAAMPRISKLGKGFLIRPFLNHTRAELRKYAESAKLQWIEDSSNANQRFDRNFLRHDIMPRLKNRWSGVISTMGRVARHQAEAKHLLEEIGKSDFQHCRGENIDQISIPAFSHLTATRQANVIRYWLNLLNLPLPRTAQLHHILNDMLTAQQDAQPLVRWQGTDIRRYRNTLFAMENLPNSPSLYSLAWSPSTPLDLPLGRLIAQETRGQGLVFSDNLTVRFRQGGEYCRWRGHRRSLKKILQAAHIFPWLRNFIPLIYKENTVVAIANIGVCDGFTAKNDEKGLLLTYVTNTNSHPHQ